VNFAGELLGRGYAPYLRRVESSGGLVFTVRLGPFPTVGEAEAAAAGRLILARDSSSIPEVTPPGAGAVLVRVDPGRPFPFAGPLREMSQMSVEERRNRSASLREHAQRCLSLDRMLDDLDTFFRETLSSGLQVS